MAKDYLVSFGGVVEEAGVTDLSRNFAVENYHSSSSSISCMEKSRVVAWFMAVTRLVEDTIIYGVSKDLNSERERSSPINEPLASNGVLGQTLEN